MSGEFSNYLLHSSKYQTRSKLTCDDGIAVQDPNRHLRLVVARHYYLMLMTCDRFHRSTQMILRRTAMMDPTLGLKMVKSN